MGASLADAALLVVAGGSRGPKASRSDWAAALEAAGAAWTMSRKRDLGPLRPVQWWARAGQWASPTATARRAFRPLAESALHRTNRATERPDLAKHSIVVPIW